jgi:hypothetical protein
VFVVEPLRELLAVFFPELLTELIGVFDKDDTLLGDCNKEFTVEGLFVGLTEVVGHGLFENELLKD